MAKKEKNEWEEHIQCKAKKDGPMDTFTQTLMSGFLAMKIYRDIDFSDFFSKNA